MEEDCEVMDMDVDELLEQEEYECIKQKSFHDDDEDDDDVIEEVNIYIYLRSVHYKVRF